MTSSQIDQHAENLKRIFLQNPNQKPPSADFSRLVKKLREAGYSDEMIVALIEHEDGPNRIANNPTLWNKLVDMVNQS